MSLSLSLPSEAGKQAIAANSSLLSASERATVDLLLSLDQAHLFASWPAPGTNDAEKHVFLAQVQQIEHDYVGGIQSYVTRARSLLRSAAEGANPYEGFAVEEPKDAVRIDTQQDFDKYEALGMQHVKDAVFIIVAGGLGERLGYRGIKLALPSDISSEQSFIELYIRNILHAQHVVREKLNDHNITLPLAIMTSDDTDALTRSFLSSHSNFGMSSEQLIIFKQGKVPSLLDNDAHFCLEGNNAWQLDTKPHGHGDVHSLLYAQGHVARWHSHHKQHAVFFQDTNGLVFHAIIAALGVSVERKLAMNSITVPRAPGDAVGAICRLTRTSPLSSIGEHDLPNTLTINVEYNQLEGLMKGHKETLIAGTNYSVYPGNINVLILSLPRYHEILLEKKGAISEFVNPKYNSDKKSFKKPTRLECMMQDYPKLLSPSDAVSFTQFQRWSSFSAVKNAIADGVAKQATNNAQEVAATGENDMYTWFYTLLKHAGATLPPLRKETYANIVIDAPPHIVLYPSFGVTQHEILSKINAKNINIKENSTLLVDGENVKLQRLELDGTLIIEAVASAHVTVDLSVHNAGWRFVELKPDDKVDQKYEIRGYTLKRNEQVFLQFTQAGNYHVTNENVANFTKPYTQHPNRR